MTEATAPPSGTVPADGPGHDHRCPSCGQPLEARATDKLTGLLDRWGWDDQAPHALTRARESGQSTALIIVDLDHFKRINDTFGHVAGDAVLRGAAGALRAATRAGDLLGRYGGHGGDEFLVLLPDTNLTDAIAVADRIHEGIRAMVVRAPTTSGAVTIAGCTVSIGVSVQLAHRDVDLLDLMLAADAALLKAKLGGRDQIRAAPTRR